MNSNHIFLTGGSGVLGLELIPRFLQQDRTEEIILLLRASEEDSLQCRLDRVKQYVQHWWPAIDLSRLRAVRGDITLPNLGLTPADYVLLQQRTTHVIHAAASTKLTLSRACATRTNILGTENVLDFAAGCRLLQRLAHVSTAYVAGTRNGLITEEDLYCGQEFTNEYERSKMTAEIMVRARRSFMPVTIFRPGIIVGDSQDGHIASFSSLYYPLHLIATGQLRRIPGSGAARLSLVTVDFAARTIVRLLQSPLSLDSIYHVTPGHDNATPARELLETAIRKAGRHPERALVFTDDSACADDSPAQSAPVATPPAPPATTTARLAVFFAYLRGHKTFDTTNLERHLGRTLEHPKPHQFLPRLLSFCRTTGWGERLPWEEVPCLAEAV